MAGQGAGDFEEWARATVEAAATALTQRLVDIGVAAQAGGVGGAITTRPGYRSEYVNLTSTPMGPLAIWLYGVPPGHEYGTSADSPQLGAGLMRHSNAVLEREVLRLRVQPGNPFRWRTLPKWEGYVYLSETDPKRSPAEASEPLVDAVLRGLRAARLVGHEDS